MLWLWSYSRVVSRIVVNHEVVPSEVVGRAIAFIERVEAQPENSHKPIHERTGLELVLCGAVLQDLRVESERSSNKVMSRMLQRRVEIEHNIELPTKRFNLGLNVLRCKRNHSMQYGPDAVGTESEIDLFDSRTGIQFFSSNSLLFGVSSSEAADSAMIDLPFLS